MDTSSSLPGEAADHADAQDLETLRRTIDGLDSELLGLLNKRAACSLAVGKLKTGTDAPVFRPGREELLFETLLARNPGPLPDSHLRAVYREILSSSRALQAPLKIAYLGPEGTFSHMAALEFFGHSLNYWAMPRFDDIFEAVENRDSELGVVPLENSLHGTISRTIDLFATHEVYIQAEWFSRISHSLLSRETALKAITKIYSHAQALGQCAEWLRATLPNVELISVDSTAAAAHRVLDEAGAAAIGHENLAQRLGLAILARGIEDICDNWTRFLAIGPLPQKKADGDKTSLLFTLPDKPGALAAVLHCFSEAGVNMNKLESRPMRSERWKYIFFCDVACDMTPPKHTALVEKLREVCHSLRILGAYPSGKYLRKGGNS